MRWTLIQVAGALGTAPGAGLDTLARMAGVSIDSRSIRPGELFIAIRGARHDGHNHVAEALERGALAAVVEGSKAAILSSEILARCFAVEDTLAALQQLARAIRLGWGRRVAGVTGSVGKTTTKEILAALLGARFRVLKSEGNFNNEYGLPLTLCRLEETHQAAVLEMGMSRQGELARLAKVALPDVGVVTRIAPAHLEFFASVDEIARAKRELIEGLHGSGSVAVLNADDPRAMAFASHAPGRVLTYGAEKLADYRAEEIEDRGALGSSFTFVWPNGRTRLEVPLAGRHTISNILAALAAASVWGVGALEAQSVLPTLRAASMRGELRHFSDGSAVINDSYNASPAALAAMIELLAGTPNFRRRILAAGEMLELGQASAQLHREAGQRAAKAGNIDWILGVQGHAREMLEGAVAAGHSSAQTRFFENSADAAAFLADFLEPGDLVLVKGSRGVKMERIVDALVARHAPADATAPGGHR